MNLFLEFDKFVFHTIFKRSENNFYPFEIQIEHNVWIQELTVIKNKKKHHKAQNNKLESQILLLRTFESQVKKFYQNKKSANLKSS